jgi:hypothetical protein
MQNHPHPRIEQLQDKRQALLAQRKTLFSALKLLPPKGNTEMRQDLRARIESLTDRIRNLRARIIRLR